MAAMSYGQTKRQIASFRIKELQECLERLGIKKQGNKAELQSRLLALFADSSVLAGSGYVPRDQHRLAAAQRIIDDVYARMSGLPLSDPTADMKLQPEGPASTSGNATAWPGRAGAAAGTSAAAAGAGGSGAAAAQQGQRIGVTGQNLTELLELVLKDGRNRSVGSPSTSGRPAGGGQGGAGLPYRNSQVRCLCSSTGEHGDMLQCSACGVWQHGACAAVPKGERPKDWCCEICRAGRSDPFWEIVNTDVLQPVRLVPTGKSAQVGTALEQMQALDRTFLLPTAYYESIKRKPQEYQLQIMCLQLNDTVPNRFHWPLGVSLLINGVAYRPYSRTTVTKLGANQRDEPANISTLVTQAKNRVVLTCTDSQPYVAMVALVRQRGMEGVKALMRTPLSLSDAIERVKDAIRGEHDEDLSTDKTVLPLKCPITGARMTTPVRFATVQGLACFDLDPFLAMAQRTRKWQCPHSMTHAHVYTLQVDTYVQRLLTCLKELPDVSEVEVNPNGRWRRCGVAGERWYSAAEDYVPGGASGAAANGASGSGAADGAGGGGGGDSDEDEEDEAEELRRAAAAVAAAAKRKRAPSPDVIVIDSDDDDDAPPPAPVQRAPAPQPPPQPPQQPPQQQQQALRANPPLYQAGVPAAASAAAPGLVSQQRAHFEQLAAQRHAQAPTAQAHAHPQQQQQRAPAAYQAGAYAGVPGAHPAGTSAVAQQQRAAVPHPVVVTMQHAAPGIPQLHIPGLPPGVHAVVVQATLPPPPHQAPQPQYGVPPPHASAAAPAPVPPPAAAAAAAAAAPLAPAPPPQHQQQQQQQQRRQEPIEVLEILSDDD